MAVLEDRVPGKPGRVLVTPENGGEAFYATLELADEPVVDGNKVNRQNVIDTIIESLSTGMLGTLRIECGSYVGVQNLSTKTLTFGFAPSMVILVVTVSSSLQPALLIVSAANETSDDHSQVMGAQTNYYFTAAGWGTNSITISKSESASNSYHYVEYTNNIHHYIAIG